MADIMPTLATAGIIPTTQLQLLTPRRLRTPQLPQINFEQEDQSGGGMDAMSILSILSLFGGGGGGTAAGPGGPAGGPPKFSSFAGV